MASSTACGLNNYRQMLKRDWRLLEEILILLFQNCWQKFCNNLTIFIIAIYFLNIL
jgi:hypothetical protein